MPIIAAINPTNKPIIIGVKILSREMNMSEAGDKLIDTTLRVANGRLTCAEALGHREFVMTKLYRSA